MKRDRSRRKQERACGLARRNLLEKCGNSTVRGRLLAIGGATERNWIHQKSGCLTVWRRDPFCDQSKHKERKKTPGAWAGFATEKAKNGTKCRDVLPTELQGNHESAERRPNGLGGGDQKSSGGRRLGGLAERVFLCAETGMEGFRGNQRCLLGARGTWGKRMRLAGKL